MPIPFFLMVLGGLFAGAVVVAFVEEIQVIISGWLRTVGWENTKLMDAVVRLSNVGCEVKRVIRVRDKNKNVHTVQEDYLSPDQITDPDILRALQQQGSIKLNVAIH